MMPRLFHSLSTKPKCGLITKNVSMYKYLFLFVILFGCKSDQLVFDDTAIQGDWYLSSAYRNGKLTGTLEKAYFKFGEKEMHTNLMGNDVGSSYVISNGIIRQTSEPNLEFKKVKVSGDTLEFTSSIRGNDFVFITTRTNPHADQ